MPMKIYDVIILGAGASGLMCAGNVSTKLDVAIVDHNNAIAKKIKISGGGKCNITNVSVKADNFDGNRELVSSVLKKFSKEKLLRFLERSDLELELRKDRYYFCKNSSDDIIDILQKNIRDHTLLLQTQIKGVRKVDELFLLDTTQGVLQAKCLVVASGGKSFEKLGASDIGLQIAKSFGLQIKDFTPALVGLSLQKEQFWMRELSGLSTYVHIKVGEKILKEDMLFAHKGISGPVVLSTSLYWKKGNITIDFFPEKNILEIVNGSKKMLSASMGIPKRLAKALLEAVDIIDQECNKLTKEQNQKLKQLHCYSFAPAGNFGFVKAEVSRGGVVAEELDIATMMSKKVNNLHFIGEVVDVTGELGGYNFQWAFSSGVVCANSLKPKRFKV
jgi:predicted Rossmann fold flavoprotein